MRRTNAFQIGKRFLQALNNTVRSGNWGHLGHAVDDTVREVTEDFSDVFFSGPHPARPPHPYGHPNQQPFNRSPVSARATARMPGKVAACLLLVLGLAIGIPLLIADVVLTGLAFSGYLRGAALSVCGAVLLPLTALSFISAGVGASMNRRISRFARYRAALGSAAFARITDLAESAGEPPARALRDLKKMVQVGVYPHGHFNEQETCFMVDDETYQEYLEAEKAYLQKEAAARAQAEKEKMDPQAAELEEIRREGNDCLLEIRAANDDIPDEAVSNKLYQLETVTGRIFQCVEQHPEKIPEIHKFMRYYLPTTLKLVQAYRDFDRQPLQGENIRRAKAEIEHALDTVNTAFANLLDSLFADDALDISTDIAALEAMLKQEGLTGSDFRRPEKQKESNPSAPQQ